jgi:hypothetical protein
MFKFTIRDIVLVTLVTAVGTGWWVDRRRLAAPLAKLAKYEQAEQIAIKRKQDENRLRDLQWKLSSVKSVQNGAPWPEGERPTFTSAEAKEMFELSKRLRDTAD